MAHELYQFENGDYSMAFVGNTPWHGLGQQIDPSAPLEVWREKAHLDWVIEDSPGAFINPDTGEWNLIPDRKILMRSDNKDFLSIVGSGYHITQPEEILGFFRDLIENAGFRIHTAGSLFNGRRIWALAEMGTEVEIGSIDKLRGYLLLASSCDGTLANTAKFTSVRVVCNNTLEMANGENRTAIKMPHSTKFDPAHMKEQLGLGVEAFSEFSDNVVKLTERKVSLKEATEFFLELYATKEEQEEGLNPNRLKTGHLPKVIDLFQKEKLETSNGTAWGLVNAVTRYYDHERTTRSIDSRVNDTWFGKGSNFKNKVFEAAMKLAA